MSASSGEETMSNWTEAEDVSRRTFVKSVAGLAGAIALGGCARMGGATASAAVPSRTPAMWADRMGLELFTVRDQIEKDFEGTLAQVAAAGYKEVETTSYASLTPAQVRAVLDRVGLSAPSTHVALSAGPELERQLAGYQQMGHRYAAARGPGGPGGGPPGARPGAAGAPGGAPPGGAGGRPTPPPATMDSIKRQAELYNQIGAAAKPYGVKVLIHNHTNEFEPFADSTTTPYEVLFANIDPELVVMELDIGWSTVAGHPAFELFAQHPRRFPLWHVKDMADLATVTSMKTQAERQRAAKIVPVGLGDINYRPIFERAADAGLEHYFIEQDTAPTTGSLDAMRLSAQNLRRALS
jgi:sugar phosphate isomerase/epimerase